MKFFRLLCAGLFLLSLAMFLDACGGSSNDTAAMPETSVTVTGSVFASPVAGAAVVVTNASGGTIAGPVTTAPNGTYSIAIPSSDVTGTLFFHASGGTFTDEATGVTVTGGAMSACVSAASLTTGAVHLDPSSSIIARMVMDHGKTLADAQTAFSAVFGYAPDTSVAPMNAPTASATAAQRLAALRAMIFSQLTKDLGLGADKQFDLLSAITDDIADDDTLNGSALVSIGTTTLPQDIMNRMERSIVSCLTNTTMNMTGLTAAEIGALPFGKIALTTTYKVEYLPGMMAATQGKTSFTIRITNRSDGSPATGLAVSLMPMMRMATMNHSTPVDAIIDNGNGTYTCTVYYLMASGPGMGFWELKVKIGGMMGETATFYPAVSMAMGGSTVRSTLKGQSDIISSMTGTEKRSYYLFRDGLSGTTGNHTFNLFIAAKESMMSYPALSTLATTTLHDQNRTPWAVSTVNVLASTDGSTWSSPAGETARGHWSFSGLTGLVSGQTATIYVKLNVNEEDKTTDGNAASGANAYSAFKVIP